MIAMIFMLVGVSVWLEWKLVHSNRFVAWFFQSRNRAIVGSVGLSVFVGSIFGAAGLICLIAGLGSTFIIQPLYAAEQRGLLVAGQKRASAGKAQILAGSGEIKRRAHQIQTVLKTVFLPVILFFKGLGWALDHLGVQ